MFEPALLARAEAHFQRAETLRNAGSHEAGLAELETGLRIVPLFPVAHLMRAEMLHSLGRLDEALAAAGEAEKRALEQKQNLPAAGIRKARILIDQARFAEAQSELKQLTKRMPDDARIAYLWGAAAYRLGEFDASIRHTRRALSLPGGITADAYSNLGLALYRTGKPQEALCAYEAALKLDPRNADAHTQRGIMLLLLGHYQEGWPEWEWRSRRMASFRNEHLAPEWQGEDLTGQTLLIYVEQGFGDMLNFARFFPVLAEMGARVVVIALERLVPVIATVPGVAEVMVARHNMPLPPHDFALPVMSLGLRLGATPQHMPGSVPYISAPEDRVRHWRGWLGDAPGLKVGVVWAGSPKHLFDAARSLPLEALRPLAMQGVRLVSLQQGLRADDDGMALERPGALSDFGDTAGLIANLDLVIAVDTAVAHLAGAMGRDTWLMLPDPPEWRWGLAGDSTPWYPTMRLFRQKRSGNWATVTAALRRALREKIA